MPRSVTIKTGYYQVALPDGHLHNAGDTVTLSDDQWSEVSPTSIGTVLTDNGATGGSGGGGGGGGGGGYTRTTVAKTTASLANAANEASTMTIEPGYRVYTVQADRACRVRLYSDTTSRDADLSRSAGTVPAEGSGVMLDVVLTRAQTLILSPLVDGFTTADDTNVPYNIANNSGATSTVTVTISYIRTE